MTGMNIAMFGSSLVSAYWNGAATYYRGIIRAMHQRGHRVTFYEPDVFERQKHRDIDDPDWAKVVVYEPTEQKAGECLKAARAADVVIKASGVGVLDEFLEAAVPELKASGRDVLYWDVDAPATLDRMRADPADPFRPLVGQYDLVLTYGGGQPVVDAYVAMGAKACIPIYNALDPDTHYPVRPDPKFQSDLCFLGNRLPDREARVWDFFLTPAGKSPGKQFLLGGNGWGDARLPSNVRYVGHVFTQDHNAFNCTPLAVLNISRQSMASYGYSPATRVFEAAGAGACLITDAWKGIGMFLEPDQEVLVANSGQEVTDLLEGLSPERAGDIGRRARRRVLTDHTYAVRAELLDRVLSEGACHVRH